MSENENKNIKKLEAPPTPAKSLKSRDKIRSSPNHPIEYKIMLAGESEPQVEVDLIKFDERLKEIKNFYSQSRTWRSRLSSTNTELRMYSFRRCRISSS